MKKAIVAAALSLACASVGAQTLFFDDFNDETAGLNRVPTGWTVTDGTVDIIGAGTVFDFQPGNGLYIDLDGSTGMAGMLSTGLSFAAGTLYELSFDLAGSHRGDTNTVTYGVDFDAALALDVQASATLTSEQDFTRFSLLFSTPVATTGRVRFDQLGGDNIGLLLDDVRVAVAIPEPQTWGLLLAGLALLGFSARRRKAALRTSYSA